MDLSVKTLCLQYEKDYLDGGGGRGVRAERVSGDEADAGVGLAFDESSVAEAGVC